MISNICYAVVFLIESLISFYYFDFKFKRRISKKFIPIINTFIRVSPIHYKPYRNSADKCCLFLCLQFYYLENLL